MRRKFEAVVEDIRLESRVGVAAVWVISLNRTEFRAGEAGVLEAITRSGTRLEMAVTEVKVDEEGVVWHLVDKPLAAGTEVWGWVEDGAIVK